ncbi:hypothetical protein TrLO_g8571 [Triparma laevis f. longispina]|uniref:Uncharacterized protein n=1 Tax=Triparma laevis f. longispina TaxID=1714387 RepID=A0A9W7KWC9_9STRA|nr:hypothetical protein TrLO_g8571 [Triparma laevis f. longispina]
MCGTLSYLTGRSLSFSAEDQTNGVWTIYLAVSQFIYYIVAGKSCRTIMRGTLQTSSIFPKFCTTGFLPVHVFGVLRNTLNNHDPHQLMVCAYWGLTKLRSIRGIAEEAIHTHDYSWVGATALIVLSWEIASVMSKIELRVLKSGIKGALQAFAKGFKKWLTSKSFHISLLISSLLTYRVRMYSVHVLGDRGRFYIDVVLYGLCFYRYSHGLFESVVERTYNEWRGKEKSN